MVIEENRSYVIASVDQYKPFVCVCVCVRERERERENTWLTGQA